MGAAMSRKAEGSRRNATTPGRHVWGMGWVRARPPIACNFLFFSSSRDRHRHA